MAGVSRWSITDCDPEMNAARVFAEKDVCAYIQNFVRAAEFLQQNEPQMERGGLICLLVFLYRHVVSLRLKHLTISAAQHLQKPLTSRHVGVINAFNSIQLWSNLSLMLDQITLDAAEESPLPLSALEADLRYVEECDLDLYVLRALAVRSGGHSACADAANKVSDPSPVSVIDRLENLSNSLLRIEHWVVTLRPLQSR